MEEMIKKLKSMDKEQLMELFSDIDDSEVITNIFVTLCDVIGNTVRAMRKDYSPYSELIDKLSQDEDAKQVDDARRYADYKSDESNY
jgi:hypothetical protein